MVKHLKYFLTGLVLVGITLGFVGTFLYYLIVSTSQLSYIVAGLALIGLCFQFLYSAYQAGKTFYED